jgi:hypothetical protein
MSTKKDYSKSIGAIWIPIIVAVSAAIGSAGGWFYDKRDQHKKEIAQLARAEQSQNDHLINDLIKLRDQLATTRSISDELNQSYLEPHWGILESYIIKVRRDGGERSGVEKNALMFALMTDLVAKDSKMVELLERYSPCAATDDFKTQSARFLEHANVYVLRFRVVPKIIASGDQLPKGKPFPDEFPDALRQEIAARKARVIGRMPGCL